MIINIFFCILVYTVATTAGAVRVSPLPFLHFLLLFICDGRFPVSNIAKANDEDQDDDADHRAQNGAYLAT